MRGILKELIPVSLLLLVFLSALRGEALLAGLAAVLLAVLNYWEGRRSRAR